MNRQIKWFSVFILLGLLSLPLITNAVCPDDFSDGELTDYIVDKDVGAIFDFFTVFPPHIRIDSGSFYFSWYLKDGSNISETSEFIIYPIDYQNRRLTNEEIVIETGTVIGTEVVFGLPIEKFDISQNRLGFIVCTTEDSKFVFANNNSDKGEGPRLHLEYTPTIDTKVAEYLDLSEKRNDEWIKIVESYNERLRQIQKQLENDIHNIKITIFAGFILLLLTRIGELIWKKRIITRNQKVLFLLGILLALTAVTLLFFPVITLNIVIIITIIAIILIAISLFRKVKKS